jgi:hypothetical protein
VGEDPVDDVGVEVDAELVGHGMQQRVGGCDRLILLELVAGSAHPARQRMCRRRSLGSSRRMVTKIQVARGVGGYSTIHAGSVDPGCQAD